MEFSLVDFLIGFFLANSIPHLVVGIMDIRFLSLFGFSAKANIAYSIWNILLASAISIYFYGIEALMHDALFWGVFGIYVSYVLSGRFLYLRWKQ